MIGAGRLRLSLSHVQGSDVVGDVAGDVTGDISGDISGSSRRADAPGWINLQHCDWLVRCPNADRRRPGSPAPLRIVKWMDRSTSQLLQALQQGWTMTGHLRFDAASTRTTTARVSWRIENAQLLDYVLMSEQRRHHAELLEHWTLDCSAMQLEHRLADGRVVTGEWRQHLRASAGGDIATSVVEADVDVGDAGQLWGWMRQPERDCPRPVDATLALFGSLGGSLGGSLPPLFGRLDDGEDHR